MGGDGGVVATNKRYMRGAGTADHTADSNRATASELAEAERERLQHRMKMCAITGALLDFTPVDGSDDGGGGGGGDCSGGMVACPYGRLYGREAAVEALLRRMEQYGNERPSNNNNNNDNNNNNAPEIGWHVRGLKDLYPVRFHVVRQSTNNNNNNNNNNKKSKNENGTNTVVEYVPSCPITGMELNGLQPAYLILPSTKTKKKNKKKKKQEKERTTGPNVLSEKAIKRMGIEMLQEEYGPFGEEDMVRLAPPSGRILEEIQNKLMDSRRRDKSKNGGGSTSNSKKKKRKHRDGDGDKDGGGSRKRSEVAKPSDIDGVRKSVSEAVASNSALSSLFVGKNSMSQKEKNDNLFARNV